MSGLRVIEVQDLGYEGAIVNIGSETLLLLDPDLDHDKRMDVMTRAMAQELDA